MMKLLPGKNWSTTGSHQAVQPGQRIFPDSPILVDGGGKPVKGESILLHLSVQPPVAWFEGQEYEPRLNWYVRITGPDGTIPMPVIRAGTQQKGFMLDAVREKGDSIGAVVQYNVITRHVRHGKDWTSGHRTVHVKDTVTVDSPMLTDLSNQPVAGEELWVSIFPEPQLALFENHDWIIKRVTASKGTIDMPRIIVGSETGSFRLRASTPDNFVEESELMFTIQPAERR